jgi:hypothetical protein
VLREDHIIGYKIGKLEENATISTMDFPSLKNKSKILLSSLFISSILLSTAEAGPSNVEKLPYCGDNGGAKRESTRR